MLITSEKIFRRVLKMSIAGTRGGFVRLRILQIIEGKGLTIPEISKKLSLNYKTIEYHLRVLERSGLVSPSGRKYNNAYSHSGTLMSYRDAFRMVSEELGKRR